jgi:hypothetical protein
MAVVQISKIQVRRGRKSQTNLPQLSGGEFGWAVDTQQLYIGNGSVSEGSPFVGNTEILTERSNIFGLLGAYTYSDGVLQTGIDSNTPYSRSLQQKLDDIVNVRDFGAQGDFSNGVGTDDTLAFQRAIDQLFLNSTNKNSPSSHIKLRVPAGIYKITSTLYIPSNVNLIGDGLDNTIIYQVNGSYPIFQTIASSSSPGVYQTIDVMNSDNAPSNVYIEGFTFTRGVGNIVQVPIAFIDCLKNSQFNKCKFIGTWVNGTGEERSPVIAGSSSALVIRGLGAVTTEEVSFTNCEFTKVAHGVYCDFDSYQVSFKDCNFTNLFRGLTFSKTSSATVGQNFGPQDFSVENSKFDKIDAEAWKVFTNSASAGHRSINNKFYDVGNNSAEQSQPVTPIIDFGSTDNYSNGDYFQRHISIVDIDVNKTASPATLIAYLPDVLGINNITYPSRSSTMLASTPVASPKVLIKTPSWSSSKVLIDYVIRKSSNDLYRSGTLTIVVHPDMVTGIIKPTFNDEFVYYGSDDTLGNVVGGDLQFYAIVSSLPSVKINPTTLSTSIENRPTLIIRYSNPSGPGGDATITYSVKIINGYREFV